MHLKLIFHFKHFSRSSRTCTRTLTDGCNVNVFCQGCPKTEESYIPLTTQKLEAFFRTDQNKLLLPFIYLSIGENNEILRFSFKANVYLHLKVNSPAAKTLWSDNKLDMLISFAHMKNRGLSTNQSQLTDQMILHTRNKFYYMASVSERSICQNTAF